MRALVTGANGFLGRHVVAALLGRGHEVRAMVRPATRLEALGWPSSVEVFRADLRASRELVARVRRRRRAAPPGGGGLRRGGRAVRGNRRRHRAAAGRDGQQRLPTAGAVQQLLGLRLQLDPPAPSTRARRSTGVPDVYARDGYAISKWWQERVTRRIAEKHGWDLTVLRPGFIWGRDHGYLAGLGQQLGRHHLVFGPLTRMPMTHVENCADVFALAAADPRARARP